MNARELRIALHGIPDLAQVFINGEVITGIELVIGKTSEDYGCTYFKPNPTKGTVKGVTFTRLVEQSDGEMRPSYDWSYT